MDIHSESGNNTMNSDENISITTNNTAQSQLEPLIVQEELPHQDLDTSRHSINSLRGPKGTLTFLNGLALIISLQIGSGIFSSPAQVSSHVASPTVAICVWVIAGALVWAGASTLVEFATSISSNGGIEEYLRFCYGETAGFLFAWVWILIAKPCANALVSLILAEHLSSAVWPGKVVGKWINVSIALFAVILTTLFNTLGTTTGARAANVFLLLKLMIAASIIVIGLSYGAVHHHSTSKPQLSHPSRGVSVAGRTTFDNHVFGISDAVSAVFGALFAYGGWENIGFIAGEVQLPEKNLPAIINTAMTIVIVSFVGINLALFAVLDKESLSSTNAVAVIFGNQVFGSTGGVTFSAMVVVSCLGALNANIFAAGRLTQEAAKRRYLPAILGMSCPSIFNIWATSQSESRFESHSSSQKWYTWINTEPLVSKSGETPVYAMLFNACVASCYVIVGTFRGLITFKGLAEYSFYFFSVAGVYILRSRNTGLERPYRVWKLNPIIFCAASLMLVTRECFTQPLQGFAILFVVAAGRIFFSLVVYPRIKQSDNDSSPQVNTSESAII